MESKESVLWVYSGSFTFLLNGKMKPQCQAPAMFTSNILRLKTLQCIIYPHCLHHKPSGFPLVLHSATCALQPAAVAVMEGRMTGPQIPRRAEHLATEGRQ